MEISYFNGRFLQSEEIKISPDDRGFLFAEGIYEVVRWYGGFFFDIESHLVRLKRSLGEIKISWDEAGSFPLIATGLIEKNNLENEEALVYIQVTRGAARRTHAFPSPPVSPTVYSFARRFNPGKKEQAIGVMLADDIRWSRCDIKSVALLPNTMLFQEALEKGFSECAFVRNGNITECSHSNIFFVSGETLFTHPVSPFILAGITRKNILSIAAREGIPCNEEPIPATSIAKIDEAFISNTSGEITPVIRIDDIVIGKGVPGPVTIRLQEKFRLEISTFKGD